MRTKDYGCNTSFLDLLFNMLLAFTALFVLSFAMINRKTQDNKNAIAKAEYLVTVTWPDGLPDDIDTYVEDPNANLVWFRQREIDFVHLDRDDQGSVNDMVTTADGSTVENTDNREIVTIRKIVEGEYTINVHRYRTRQPEPVEVTICVERLNPYVLISKKKVVLEKEGDEKTVIRFNVNKSGDVTSTNEDEKSFTHDLNQQWSDTEPYDGF